MFCTGIVLQVRHGLMLRGKPKRPSSGQASGRGAGLARTALLLYFNPDKKGFSPRLTTPVGMVSLQHLFSLWFIR